MINNYEVPDVVEIGKPQDVILGSLKCPEIFYDGVNQSYRETEQEDDE